MSCVSEHRTFPQLLAAAIRRRLYPVTALHRKQLCDALRVSAGSLDNWLSGNNAPSGETVVALMKFFDPAFALEISGGVVVKLEDARTAQLRRLRDAADLEYRKAIGGQP